MNSSPESTMPGTVSVLRANEGLMTALALLAGVPFVLCLVAVMVQSAGASLKPMVFMLGFAAPVGLALFVAQLVRARRAVPVEVPGPGLEIQRGQFADRERVFGRDVPAFLIRDVKATMPGVFDEAEVAESGVTMNVETVLVAQFPSSKEARRAVTSYQKAFLLQGVTGDEVKGWTAKRSLQGDYVEMLCRGRVLFVWTGLSREACAERRAQNDVEDLVPVSVVMSPAPLFPSLQTIADWVCSRWVKVLGVLLLATLYVGWFFKGAIWAASTTAAPAMLPMSGQELAQHLMSLNQLDVPLRIEQGATPDELIADWRYTDPKWVDQARAQEVTRSFRIRLVLDEATRVVRATDYLANFDWSTGHDAVPAEWNAMTGPVFFLHEQQEVPGLRMDKRGRFVREPDYCYHFDLREMKSPLVSAITRAGWTWQPTVWEAPKWLAWLAE